MDVLRFEDGAVDRQVAKGMDVARDNFAVFDSTAIILVAAIVLILILLPGRIGMARGIIGEPRVEDRQVAGREDASARRAGLPLPTDGFEVFLDVIIYEAVIAEDFPAGWPRRGVVNDCNVFQRERGT